MFIEQYPDLNKVFQYGFQAVDINQSISKLLNASILRVEIISNEQGHNALEGFSIQSLTNQDIPIPLQIFISELEALVLPVTNVFSGGDKIKSEIGIARALKDFKSQWGQEQYRQPVIGFYCILPSATTDLLTQEAVLEFRKIEFGDGLDIKRSEITGQIKANPKAAKLIIYNPSSLLYQHKFSDAVTRSGNTLIYGNMGALNV